MGNLEGVRSVFGQIWGQLRRAFGSNSTYFLARSGGLLGPSQKVLGQMRRISGICTNEFWIMSRRLWKPFQRTNQILWIHWTTNFWTAHRELQMISLEGIWAWSRRVLSQRQKIFGKLVDNFWSTRKNIYIQRVLYQTLRTPRIVLN